MELCQSRVKQLDSPRNRLLLAKAFLHQKKPEKAEEQAQIILKGEPDNLAACLVLIAADLKRSDNPRFLDEAGFALHHAMDLLQAMPHNAEWADRHREISLNLAIWAWLQDDPEYQKMGKAAARNVLTYLPDDQTAKDILKAME